LVIRHSSLVIRKASGMKYVFLATSSFLAIVAQMIAGNNFSLLNFLDLSLVLTAYWALHHNRIQALFMGSLTGLLLDAALGWPLGYNGFGKTLAAYLIAAAVKRFNVEGTAVRFALIAASSIASSMSIFVLFSLLQRSSSAVFFGASLMQAIVTGAAGALVLSIVDGYHRTRANRVG
jgi:rod shape-determining protein MreD